MDKMRFNDGKAAPGGAVIIGRMHADWRKGAPGRLYKWGPPSPSMAIPCSPHIAECAAHLSGRKLPAVCSTAT